MKLYNTLSRQIETLQPLEKGTVKIYTCGLTVYSQPHIGNWLPYIYWDVLVRTLRISGYNVLHTQNITDVGHLTSDDDNGEDKMEKGARNEGVTAWDVAAKYIAIAAQEATSLGLQPPSHLVRATDTIAEQIEFATILDKKGYLYEIPGDGMYFDTSKFPDYGRLARLDIDGLDAGARVRVEGKRNITDFAVWKFSPKDSKRDMEWESPWGVGFPGWHLECSVIARHTLGDQLDIHCGGIDHIPVHHINEIAQTEAVTGKPFSQFWVHANHMKVDGKKMSKSLGNIYTLAQVSEHGYERTAFKVFALQKHYRTEGNFTWENLSAAAHRLEHWREAAALVWQPSKLPTDNQVTLVISQAMDKINNALQQDLSTPQALAVIDEVSATVLEAGLTTDLIPKFLTLIHHVSNCLGIDMSVNDITDDQKALIQERELARTNKDWAASDRLRLNLEQQGIMLRDTASGCVWYPRQTVQ